MGYTHGRILTENFVREQALKYGSRGEFCQRDHPAYNKAIKLGILDDICKHMIPQSNSMPQKITKYIFDKLLNMEGLYNNRTRIYPFELDIYYPKLNFAIEYNGEYWHSPVFKIHNTDRERIKNEKIIESKINVLFIEENCERLERNYIKFIKTIIKDNIPIINVWCNTNITQENIEDLEIDLSDEFFQVLSWENVERILSRYSSLKELRKKRNDIYRLISKYPSKKYLLNTLKDNTHKDNRKRRAVEQGEFIANMLNKYRDFDYLKSSIIDYSMCMEMGVINKLIREFDIKNNPKRRVRRFNHEYILSDDSFIEKMVDDYDNYTEFCKKYIFYQEAVKRKVLDTIKFKLHNKIKHIRVVPWFKLISANEKKEFILNTCKTYKEFKQYQNGTLYQCCCALKMLEEIKMWLS